MKTKEQISHDGHRQRQLESMSAGALRVASEVEQLEFILTYILPRGDVNPLAHRLLKKFGNIPNVLNANVEELKMVYGINERAAKKIAILPEIIDIYLKGTIAPKVNLTLYGELCDFIELNLRAQREEQLLILGVNARGRLIRSDILARGVIDKLAISPRAITNFINSTIPYYVMLVHNHPGGLASATALDVDGNNHLKHTINCCGAHFLDHYVQGEDGIFSIEENRYLRTYTLEDLKVETLREKQL